MVENTLILYIMALEYQSIREAACPERNNYMRLKHLVATLGIVSLLLLAPSQRLSADSWTTMTSGTANNLYALWGMRDTYIFAAGSTGTIIKHTSSTDAWDSPAMTSGVATDLFSLWGSFGTAGYNNAIIYLYAAGTNRIIVYTSGGNWTDIKQGVFTVRGIWGSSESNVYAAGDTGVLLHSSNASSTSSAPTWTDLSTAVPPSGTAGINLLCAWGTSAANVYVGGEVGNIFHYDGSTWTSQTSNTIEDIRAIWGTSPTNIYAVGSSGLILHSDGTTWTDISPGVGVTINQLNAIWGSSASDIFAAGENGTVLYSSNGTVWTNISPGAGVTTNHINAIWGSTTGKVYFACNGGIVFRRDRDVDAIAPLILSVSAPSITSGRAYVNPQQIGGISIYFSEPMDSATLTTSTITLAPTSGGAAIVGTVTYDSANMLANFIPNSNLGYSTSYRLTVTTGTKDDSAGGNALAQNFTSDFTTEDAPASGSGSGGTCFISTARM